MTVDRAIKSLRSLDDAQLQHALVEAVNTPAIQEAMKVYTEKVGAHLREQIDLQKLLPPSLFEQMQEQNEAIREVLDSPGIRSALANINFRLPEGLADQIAAHRDQLAQEVVAAAEAADPGVTAERVGRFAQEREAIIKCLRRVGIALEGISYLPESPIPPLVGFLILLLAAISEVADEILSEPEES